MFDPTIEKQVDEFHSQMMSQIHAAVSMDPAESGTPTDDLHSALDELTEKLKAYLQAYAEIKEILTGQLEFFAK